jgi:hypothetical protein
MTELWREGITQGGREEFSGGEEMDGSRRADAELPTSRKVREKWGTRPAAPAPWKKRKERCTRLKSFQI